MSQEREAADPGAVVKRWIGAINRHDPDAIAACFDPDYRDEAPARRGEQVRGAAEVRKNFARLLQDVPDVRAELRAHVVEGNHVWIEWRMHGTRRDGSQMEFAGMNIFEVRDGRFVQGRIYTELVREAGGIEAQIDRITRGFPER